MRKLLVVALLPALFLILTAKPGKLIVTTPVAAGLSREAPAIVTASPASPAPGMEIQARGRWKKTSSLRELRELAGRILSALGSSPADMEWRSEEGPGYRLMEAEGRIGGLVAIRVVAQCVHSLEAGSPASGTRVFAGLATDETSNPGLLRERLEQVMIRLGAVTEVVITAKG